MLCVPRDRHPVQLHVACDSSTAEGKGKKLAINPDSALCAWCLVACMCPLADSPPYSLPY